jgi:hypothetical protein
VGSSQATIGLAERHLLSHVYTARPRPQAFPAAAVALDFGLRVRVDGHALQRTFFSGAENLSLQELCSELGLMISELRIRSFALRHALERLTDTLLVNVRCGFWLQARSSMRYEGPLPCGHDSRSDRGSGREAYRYGEKLGSQGERVFMEGDTEAGMTIQMWVNRATKTIETACPEW